MLFLPLISAACFLGGGLAAGSSRLMSRGNRIGGTKPTELEHQRQVVWNERKYNEAVNFINDAIPRIKGITTKYLKLTTGQDPKPIRNDLSSPQEYIDDQRTFRGLWIDLTRYNAVATEQNRAFNQLYDKLFAGKQVPDIENPRRISMEAPKEMVITMVKEEPSEIELTDRLKFGVGEEGDINHAVANQAREHMEEWLSSVRMDVKEILLFASKPLDIDLWIQDATFAKELFAIALKDELEEWGASRIANLQEMEKEKKTKKDAATVDYWDVRVRRVINFKRIYLWEQTMKAKQGNKAMNFLRKIINADSRSYGSRSQFF